MTEHSTQDSGSKNSDNRKNFLIRIKVSLLNLFLAVIFAFLVKVFFIDTTYVTSSSMEQTLLVGDFLFVNKFIFGAKNEVYFPLLGLDSLRFDLPGLRMPDRGEIILFKNPGRRDDLFPKEKMNFVKRCIGLPGDTVQIINGTVFINGSELSLTEDVTYGKSKNPSGDYRTLLFPKGSNWTIDNYGPLYIPKRGDRIKLSVDNVELYRSLIDREIGDKSVTIDGSRIQINGEYVSEYEIKENYFFVLGDNRYESADSRYWGYLPETKILGKVFLIYWSVNPLESDSSAFNFTDAVRWNRIAKILY